MFKKLTSFKNILKRSGPNIEPWGTPCFTNFQSDFIQHCFNKRNVECMVVEAKGRGWGGEGGGGAGRGSNSFNSAVQQNQTDVEGNVETRELSHIKPHR